jgi:hypothetical protein
MDVTIKCPCPPKADGAPRHETDTVTLRDRLPFRERTTIRKAISLVDNDDERGRAAEILAVLSEFYLLMGVQSWTLVDAKGKPIEVSQRAIRDVLLEAPDVDLVVEAADELYNEAILLPLLLRASTSSQPTPTPSPDGGSSTSAPMTSPQKQTRQSKQSSTTTSPTADIVRITTSLDGGSSSSENSQSAA